MNFLLETERLLLRPIESGDLDELCGLYSDADVMKFLHVPPMTREQIEARHTFMLDHWRLHGFGMWMMFRKTDDAFVGRCGLRYLDDTQHIELGYTLHKAFWGQGLATEASQAVVRFAFESLKLPRLVAVCDPQHTASMNVMRKVGMSHAGTGRFYNSECVMYALEAERP
jgi:RimJ/RimL family protein N-acetyltransferase